jgi:hypothetical protein
MPMAKRVFQGAFEDVNADVQEALNCIFIPTHLLALRHPLGNDFVDRRLDETSGDPHSATITLAIVGHGIRIQLSRCTLIEDWRPNLFNACPRFTYKSFVFGTRTDVLKSKTNFSLKFVLDLDAKAGLATGQGAF